MQTKIYLILLLVLSVNAVGQELKENQIYLADPTIFEDSGTYYLYGTKGDPRIEGEGFLVYTSKDLENWKGPMGASDGFALKKGDAFGGKGFWAPQIFKNGQKYYMAYTANENISIASSDSPLGPFTNDMKALKAPVKQIDPFVFFDNGKVYLYHVRLKDGNRIFVAEMTDNLKSIKPETLKECLHAEEGWEDTQNVDWPVAEGPTVIKKDDIYYMLYSSNDFRNPDYAVGYATAKDPIGPWKKAKTNPIIFEETTGHPGTGHGDVFTYDGDAMEYVLHTHFSSSKVSPRKTGLIKLKFIQNEDGTGKIIGRPETFRFIKKE